MSIHKLTSQTGFRVFIGIYAGRFKVRSRPCRDWEHVVKAETRDVPQRMVGVGRGKKIQVWVDTPSAGAEPHDVPSLYSIEHLVCRDPKTLSGDVKRQRSA